MTMDRNDPHPLPPTRVAICVAAVAVLCYANALANGFTLDDIWLIIHNSIVQRPSGVWLGFVHSYWPEFTQAGQYRPLVITAFTVDWFIDRIVAPGRATWFHLVNVAWHALASVLVWRYLRTMMPSMGAAIGALLFAVQPVHVEAVSNIVGRSEIMMTAFVLMGLLAHRRGSPLAILCFALAVLSKESGVVFVGLAAADDLLLWGEPRARFVARRWLYAAYIAVGILYAGVLAWIFHHGHFVRVAPTWKGAPAWQRWLTVLRLIPEYVRLMVLPLTLRIDYTPNTITRVTSVTPLVVLGAALLATMVACVVATWRRAPAVAFGFVFFAIALSPVSNVFFASGVVIAERTLYLPSVGAAILAGWVAQWALARRPLPALAFAMGLAAVFAVRSWTRTPIWHDNKTMAVAVLSEQPESYRAHATAATVFNLVKNWPASKREAARARTLYQQDPTPYLAGVEADLALGSPHDSVYALLDSAVAVDSAEFACWIRSAEVRYWWGDYRTAMAYAWRAYQLSPDSVRAIRYVTLSAQQLHDYGMADTAFRRAIADHPDVGYLRTGYAAMQRARAGS
jgi:protein O-mannosyl-transferase